MFPNWWAEQQRKEKKLRFSEANMEGLSKQQDEMLAQIALKVVQEQKSAVAQLTRRPEEIKPDDYDDFNAF